MYKLIILIGPVANSPTFGDEWPQFLHNAESMPGLLREATTRIQTSIYGDSEITMIHELFFKTPEALYQALASPYGQTAGETLQKITHGQMNLLIAEHKEDSIENLRSYRKDTSHADAE